MCYCLSDVSCFISRSRNNVQLVSWRTDCTLYIGKRVRVEKAGERGSPQIYFQKRALLVRTRKCLYEHISDAVCIFLPRNALLWSENVIFTILIFNKLCIQTVCFSNKEVVSLRGLLLLRYGRKRNDTSK